MKKIVTAAAIAAMAASFAAAEVTVGLNVRVRPDLYKVVGTTENGDKDAYTTTTYADIDGFASSNDTLSIKGSTDYAGVAADITLTNPGNKAGKDGGFAIDNYYGWLNWGALKFTAGTYDSRYTNRGNYTATEQGILDEEFSKTHGLSTKNGLSKADFGKKVDFSWLGDFGNVSQVAAGNNNSFIADYTFNDIAGGKLLLKGGLVENGASKNYDDTSAKVAADEDKFIQSEGYVFEAAWRKDGIAAVDFIFKNPVNKLYGFGLYVTPLMIANTKNVVVGFTYGMDTKDYAKDKNGLDKAFAIDLRGQYNINSNMTVALGAKYESVSYQNDVTLKDSDGKDVKESSASAMQVAAEFSYKVNDLVTAAFDFGYFNKDLTDVDSNSDDDSQFIVTSLRGKFTAGKNAAITTALRLNKVLNPKDGGTDYTFDIPVVLRVKM